MLKHSVNGEIISKCSCCRECVCVCSLCLSYYLLCVSSQHITVVQAKFMASHFILDAIDKVLLKSYVKSWILHFVTPAAALTMRKN